MTFRPIYAVCLSLAMAAASPALAQTASKQMHPKQSAKKPAAKSEKEAEKPSSGPKLISQYGDWGVYVSNSSSKICYALAEPKERKPAGLSRDPGYLFVSTRPSENVHDELSVVVGFPIKEDADAALDVGGQSFPLYTKNDSAWLKNAAEEAKLIEALRKQNDLDVKTTSTRGNATTDHYSLIGISQALDRVAQECK